MHFICTVSKDFSRIMIMNVLKVLEC